MTLLSPLVPVVPSQTNGAHYSHSKNSRRCHLIYSPHPSPSLSLSFFSFPKVPLLFLFFRTSPGREMSNGEKACQLIHQLAEPCAALKVGRLRRDCGSEQPSPSAARLSRSLLYGRGATGQKVKMNQWAVFIRGQEKQWTSPWASAAGPVIHAGGKRQTVCTQNIYQGARGDDHKGIGSILLRLHLHQNPALRQKSGIHLFSTRLSL